jgi:hypothetical protein
MPNPPALTSIKRYDSQRAASQRIAAICLISEALSVEWKAFRRHGVDMRLSVQPLQRTLAVPSCSRAIQRMGRR